MCWYATFATAVNSAVHLLKTYALQLGSGSLHSEKFKFRSLVMRICVPVYLLMHATMNTILLCTATTSLTLRMHKAIQLYVQCCSAATSISVHASVPILMQHALPLTVYAQQLSISLRIYGITCTAHTQLLWFRLLLNHVAQCLSDLCVW
jgi:hypothetical protein